MGKCKRNWWKNNFGSIGFGIGDSRYVDNTVIITDIVVDCVCLVDEIGNQKK